MLQASPDKCSGPALAAADGGILALVLLADLAYMGRSGVHRPVFPDRDSPHFHPSPD